MRFSEKYRREPVKANHPDSAVYKGRYNLVELRCVVLDNKRCRFDGKSYIHNSRPAGMT